MPNITTCTKCGSLYEAGSEEQANEQERLCSSCRLAPWCQICGWRKWGNDSWNGRSCKCGTPQGSRARRARSHGARV